MRLALCMNVVDFGVVAVVVFAKVVVKCPVILNVETMELLYANHSDLT